MRVDCFNQRALAFESGLRNQACLYIAKTNFLLITMFFTKRETDVSDQGISAFANDLKDLTTLTNLSLNYMYF